jgi:3-hydroxy-9,10-secoandrosta-1,3,5(10)-triene-9,17-dione monooxygenase reductase component
LNSEQPGTLPPTTDAVRLRRALGTFATGVTIVTALDATGQRLGVTANSFNSLSLAPPMVLWSLARNAYSLPTFLGAERFVVHVLADDQGRLSERFATRGSDKFAGLEHDLSPEGLPLLRNCLARFDCRKAHTYEGGDHLILVGQVERFDYAEGMPLVFHSGRYAKLHFGEATARLLALQAW